MKKTIAIAKGVISYIAAIILAVVFALFLDANVGWFILVALLLAPVVSVLLTWISSLLIRVQCEASETLLSKGDKCTLTVCIDNRWIFPTPQVEVTFVNEPGIVCREESVLVSVMPLADREFDTEYTAGIAGAFDVGVAKVKVMDYLGLFTFNVKTPAGRELSRSVSVIPEIAQISSKDETLVKAMQMSHHLDEGDDTTEAGAYTFGGFPGYESREYVPGDPLKRINWKQSAKKDKLLVRLDDEMASQSINLVLDSTFHREAVNLYECAGYARFSDCAHNEIIPLIEESAVENSLGLAHVLVRHGYTVNFWAYDREKYVSYELQNEADIESVRLSLAGYRFVQGDAARFPDDLAVKKGSSISIYSTPNEYQEAYEVLHGRADTLYTTIYSVMEQVKKEKESCGIRYEEEAKPEEPVSGFKKIMDMAAPLVIPYLLALVLSLSVFDVFEVPLLSGWTIAQMFVCAIAVALCEYTRRNKLAGGLLTTILVVGLLMMFGRLVLSKGEARDYMSWFLSGGDSVDTTATYLVSLLMVFTVFFALVGYYFSAVLYRTSFLLLVSLIPFVIHVKIVHEINMVHVILITALNVAAFMLDMYKRRNAGRRRIGYGTGIFSVGIYMAIFVFMGLAVPKQRETMYYYVFEDTFLGGNSSSLIPAEYYAISDYSGDADGFNELNARKLYSVASVHMGGPLYLRRQVFDHYDFVYDRWYSVNKYSEPVTTLSTWDGSKSSFDLTVLVNALYMAEEIEPGFMKKYNMHNIPRDFVHKSDLIYIEATNYPSMVYITPTRAVNLEGFGLEECRVTLNGVFRNKKNYNHKNYSYTVNYYDQFKTIDRWIACGGSNMSYAESLKMLEELYELIRDANPYDGEYYDKYCAPIRDYIDDLKYALEYQKACALNTQSVSYRVKELAAEITKDCEYDWQKAEALKNYFAENNFVYDLEYEAEDDSVEHFLFESRTGTCSDYSSAYVLMARSVGLIVRYVEGFVPEDEQDGMHIVRTNTSHAYPEVFIENVGFRVYEATNAAVYNETLGEEGNSVITMFATVAIRVVLILAQISAVLIIFLFISKIATPFVKEQLFKNKIKKVSAKQALVMIYRRLTGYTRKDIMRAATLTAYEYGEAFETMYNYDISRFVYMLEDSYYSYSKDSSANKEQAMSVYEQALKSVKLTRKRLRKEKRKKK